jgi:hypothetical protein
MPTMKLPDGNGGWVEVEATATHDGQTADAERQAAAQRRAFIEDAGAMTEAVNKFMHAYAKDHELSKEHVAFSMALLLCNIRNEYPDGPEAFDKIAEGAQDYYDENTRAPGR